MNATGRPRRTARRRAVATAIALSVVAGASVVAERYAAPGKGSPDPYQDLAVSSCNPTVLPTGQAHPAGEAEPLRPVWCYQLHPVPVTRVGGSNSWLDEFDTHREMGRLDDRDMDYRVFEDGRRGTLRSKAFTNQNHWMVDIAAGDNGGVLLRPDRSFRFADGKLVVEADVAAAIPEYSDAAAVEIDVTTAPAPTGRLVDSQYGYGLFGGHWTFGCRFQPDRHVTCSLFNASQKPGDATVFGNELGRVWQMLPFQPVGTISRGGAPDGENAGGFRRCGANKMDLLCRDRFRLELTRDRVAVFVNGQPYFEQSGIPPRYQFPDEFLHSDLYVYFTSWINRPLAAAYRCHWDRLAVNPSDASGAGLPPSAAPSFDSRPLR
jgi:hypothetical protein